MMIESLFSQKQQTRRLPLMASLNFSEAMSSDPLKYTELKLPPAVNLSQLSEMSKLGPFGAFHVEKVRKRPIFASGSKRYRLLFIMDLHRVAIEFTAR
jgi:hypothetical protein